jgi:hypothetical protein
MRACNLIQRMPKSPPKQSTPDQLFASLPGGRRDALERVREVVSRNLPDGYEESTAGDFIVWQVPFSRYSDTYNGKPLWYVALAAQKNYLALYLMNAYGSEKLARRLRDGFKAAGKKLDMGKSCIRFKSADDLELGVIGEVVGAVPVEQWIAIAQAARSGRKAKPAASPKAKRGKS